VKLTEEQIAELRAKNPKAFLLEASTGESVVVARPARKVLQRFFSELEEPARRPAAFERLVKACLLHPTAEEFTAMLEDRPGLDMTFANEIVKDCGLAASAEKKAL
jgi:hypothetical protein